MSDIKLSLFASAVRPHLWKELLDSLKGGKYKYEVVFAGFIDEELWKPYAEEYPEFRYIQTEDTKPAQCYEVARRNCTGTLIMWIADDCVFSEGFVDKIIEYFASLPNYKSVVSCKTNENGMNETMQNHRFFGRNWNTPLMCPLGVMNLQYLQDLGGLDRRYIAGQYENDIVMRVLADGGKTYLYEDVFVSIDHKNKHGSETNFWNGYNEDRQQLENSWVIGGYKPSPEPFIVQKGLQPPFMYYPLNNTEVTLKRNDVHEPFTYSDERLKKESEGPKGQWQ